ncbi:hypothetical protein ACQP1W_11775 [Spirillospora sp. CA-255316]
MINGDADESRGRRDVQIAAEPMEPAQAEGVSLEGTGRVTQTVLLDRPRSPARQSRRPR